MHAGYGGQFLPESRARMGDHLSGVLRTIVAGAFTGELDTDRLQAELPNVQQLYDDAVQRGDLADAVRFLGALIDLAGITSWGANGWAERTLALPDAERSPHRRVFLGARVDDLFVRGEHRALRRAGLDVLEAAHDPLPW
jgi:hypothetical protein